MTKLKAYGLAAFVWLFVAFAPAHAAPALIPPEATGALGNSALLVEVYVNGQATVTLAMLRTRADGCDEMETAALRGAGLYEGAEAEICLQALETVAYLLDRESARIDVFAESLAPEASGHAGRQRKYARELTGLIGQYGLSVQRVEDPAETYENGFADLSLTLHTGAGRLLNDVVASWDGGETDVQRLATAYERDFPDSMTRLVIGDSFTRAPRWGRLSAFAGVQYGTDFSMDPEQTYRPYRTFQTLLRQQSEIDVRVNGALRERTSVGAGFSEIEVNPEAGLNDVEIAIRDGTGLTRIEEMSFFAPADSLARGVSDYSVSIGVPRRFDGLRSEYGTSLLASGLVRRGLSDSVTAEAQGEIGSGAATAGAGAQVAAGQVGVLNVSASLSENDAGARGHLVSLGLERNTRRGSLQLQARVADPEYTDAAAEAGADFPDVSLRASAGVYTPAGSFRTSYSELRDKALPDRRFVSAGWEKSVSGNQIILAINGFCDLEQDESGLTVSLRINTERYSVRASRDRMSGVNSEAVDVSRLRQAGERLQWSVQTVNSDAGTAAQGSLQADLGAAEAFLHGGSFGDTKEISAGVRGGFTAVGRKVVLARQTTPATARVHAPGLAGVPVYQDNRKVAVFDEHGEAVIAGVRPFEVNRLSLRPDDVPLTYELASFDLDFVPRRGISEVSFGLARGSSLAFTVILPDGQFLAAGSLVELTGTGVTCPAGMDGRVYCAAASNPETVLVHTPVGTFKETVSALRRTGRMLLGAPAELKYAVVW